ncbi:MAG: flavin reductase [Ruminococcus sp.]|jgi:flavorubredoxin/flavin reductase (DIM6/NTAB) family NADH-FMN oxidoreductase RutF|nr:flavin reductase [Ruminococcus sp.]MBQ1807485.1 flavin reductase [Ruminococcus sp.]MBQ2570797.1 flavin reductase [Ruminococcus sp.]MBQ5381533.1 flavin reductase [Ruminococcus sp.]MEE1105098.1 flavin reductase [Ruminococcus sp.]
MKVTNDIIYVGVNDHKIDLFEGQYVVPNGMAYNSYVIRDQKIAVMDTVDRNFKFEWLNNLDEALGERKPDYLVVQHMEPDHSANIFNFMNNYPDATIVSSAKAFAMMKNFFGTEFEDRRIVVKEGDTLELGEHTLHFVAAPMVHWPEVIMTYDSKDKVLFSADGFGKFGALDVEEDWACEARRYYIGIVGKYGAQVQNVLKKAATLDIQIICPLHGPVLSENLGYYLNLYNTWSSYSVETEGIMIAYTSVYGNTKQAVELLAEKLKSNGCPKVVVNDLAREDMAECVEDAFRYGRIVLATTTYNAEIFPFMREFINHLTERNFQNKQIALIENGSWAPLAAKTMKKMLEGCKKIEFVEPTVRIMSALSDDSRAQIDALAKALCHDYIEQDGETANKNDLTALFNIGYGLYVVTSNDGKKDNGLIVNTVTQVTNSPNRVAVCINKQNYSHHTIKQTGVMNVNCLSVDAPFSVFQNFGFQSGKNVDKFADWTPLRSDNGLVFLPKYINSFMSLKVEDYIDLDTHGMFICSVTEARVLSDKETMTYTYYQNNVKPKPETEGKKGWVCKICGYVYEGEELPEDFICPLCKHGVADFEPIE